MDSLILNDASRRLIDAYLRDPSQALMLSGEVGVGLETIAHQLALKLSKIDATITIISPEKNLIPIDKIRQLYTQTRSVQSGKRCFIIDDADNMSVDAQNALLKLLEEPVRNIYFILTTHNSSQILQTIRSRTQIIDIRPLSQSESMTYLETYDLDKTARAQMLFLASGRPAELCRLATNEPYFLDQTSLIKEARKFLQTDSYSRLSVLKKYTDRQNALAFLTMCSKLLVFSALKQKNASTAKTMEAFDVSMDRISHNGHVRTHLMHLVTKL